MRLFTINILTTTWHCGDHLSFSVCLLGPSVMLGKSQQRTSRQRMMKKLRHSMATPKMRKMETLIYTVAFKSTGTAGPVKPCSCCALRKFVCAIKRWTWEGRLAFKLFGSDHPSGSKSFDPFLDQIPLDFGSDFLLFKIFIPLKIKLVPNILAKCNKIIYYRL